MPPVPIAPSPDAADPRPRPRVVGYLRARCEHDPRSGRCFLARKAFKTPIHISKPYWSGHSLLLNLMCPTAGMLGGDEAELDIEVGQAASLTVSNPSSLRIHKMDEDEDSRWVQNFAVGPSAFLENNPEWLILQGQSAFTQRTRIDLQEDAELFFVEAIAPGRVAHGEAFRFRRFRNRFELRCQDRLVALEKHDLQPKRGDASAWGPRPEDRPFYVSIFLASPKLEPKAAFWDEIHALDAPGLQAGSSQLNHPNCWNVKVLARDPADARQAVAAIRRGFYQAVGRQAAPLRRQ